MGPETGICFPPRLSSLLFFSPCSLLLEQAALSPLCVCVFACGQRMRRMRRMRERGVGGGGGLSLDLIPAKRTVCFTADDPRV